MSGNGWTKDNVVLREHCRGEWEAWAGGHHFLVLLIDRVWVVYVDGVEKCSAFRLQIAHEKVIDLLSSEAVTR